MTAVTGTTWELPKYSFCFILWSASQRLIKGSRRYLCDTWVTNRCYRLHMLKLWRRNLVLCVEMTLLIWEGKPGEEIGFSKCLLLLLLCNFTLEIAVTPPEGLTVFWLCIVAARVWPAQTPRGHSVILPSILLGLMKRHESSAGFELLLGRSVDATYLAATSYYLFVCHIPSLANVLPYSAY